MNPILKTIIGLGGMVLALNAAGQLTFYEHDGFPRSAAGDSQGV